MCEARVAADAIGCVTPHHNQAASRRQNTVTGGYFVAPLCGTLLYMAFVTCGIGGYARLAIGYAPMPLRGILDGSTLLTPLCGIIARVPTPRCGNPSGRNTF